MTDQYGNNYPPQQPPPGQQPPYGQDPYGHGAYPPQPGQPPQQGYPHQGYQQPPYGGGYPPQPGQEDQPPKKNRGVLWGSLGVGAAAIGGLVGFLVVQAIGDDDDNSGTASEETENEPDAPAEEEENDDDANGETEPVDNGGGEDPAVEEEVPEFEEIAPDTFNLMQQAESLRIDGEGDLWGADAADMGAIPGESQSFVIAGEPGGNLWMSFEMFGAEMELLDVGHTAYAAAGPYIALMSEAAPPEFADVDFDAMAEDLEGYWMDGGEPLGLDIAEITQEFDIDAFEASASTTTPGELSEHNGQEVWVYQDMSQGEEMEFAIAADRSEPYLVYLSGDMDGDEVTMEFSEWNSAELPEEPSASDVITEADLESMMMDYM